MVTQIYLSLNNDSVSVNTRRRKEREKKSNVKQISHSLSERERSNKCIQSFVQKKPIYQVESTENSSESYEITT